VVLFGISTPFGMLSPARGKITHVLLTRAPLYRGRSPFSLDLHVLGAPLTFVLSQDQTLQLKSCRPAVRTSRSAAYFFSRSTSPHLFGLKDGRIAGPAMFFAGFRSAQFSRTEGKLGSRR